MACSFHGLDAEECGRTDLHGEVLSSRKIGYFYLVLPLEGNINGFDLNHSVSQLIALLMKTVVFPLKYAS